MNGHKKTFQLMRMINVQRHYPEYDVIKGDPVIELMRVSRDFRSADADLASKREKYKIRKEEADREWEDLREKEKLLRQSFIKFDDFIKENREKRVRAERKIKEEKEIQKMREIEVRSDVYPKLSNITELPISGRLIYLSHLSFIYTPPRGRLTDCYENL
jgi:predicted RNase H-like nuclease (RuvC/YqgF family)